MKKGFTLVEMLGSIIILAIIALIAFPAVLNLLGTSQNKIDDSTKKYVLEAARSYVNDHVNDYPRVGILEEKKEIIYISTLKNEGYISDNTYDNKKDLLEGKCVSVGLDENKNYEFKFGECS